MTIRRKRPRGHIARLHGLKRAVQAIEEQTDHPLKETFTEEMRTLLTAYTTNRRRYLQDELAYRLVKVQRDRLSKQLRITIRHFWDTLRARTERLGHDPHIMILFGLNEGRRPRNVAQAMGWVEIAQEVLNGEAVAITRGFPPMENPSAPEIQALMVQNREAANQTLHLRHRLSQLREEGNHLAKATEDILSRLYRRLQIHLEYHEPAARRRIMTQYGIQFSSDSR